jgi:hypothetical protein
MCLYENKLTPWLLGFKFPDTFHSLSSSESFKGCDELLLLNIYISVIFYLKFIKQKADQIVLITPLVHVFYPLFCT